MKASPPRFGNEIVVAVISPFEPGLMVAEDALKIPCGPIVGEHEYRAYIRNNEASGSGGLVTSVVSNQATNDVRCGCNRRHSGGDDSCTCDRNGPTPGRAAAGNTGCASGKPSPRVHPGPGASN